MKHVINTIILLAATAVMAGQSAWADSGVTTVNNWDELRIAINNGSIIELDGDDVYYAEDSGIHIDSGTVTIDGKGHTIDALNLNAHIFEINDGATLFLKDITLKNDSTDVDGGAIYIDKGTLIVDTCTFINNKTSSEEGAAIYNYEGTLKITRSTFDKNAKYDRAIYNYGEEDNPFRLTIINTTLIEDKVAVNYEGEERRLDDKRDIDLLSTEVNANIPEVIYEKEPVIISLSGIDTDYTGIITVWITNHLTNYDMNVANGEGLDSLSLDKNRYTFRFKNFISLTDNAFERDDTKPYLELDFKVVSKNSFSALEDMISKTTDTISLSQDYVRDSLTDSPNIRITDRKLTIFGNRHIISGGANNDNALFFIEDDSDVRMENLILENGRGESRNHLGSQIRMGGAIFVSHSTLTLKNDTLKNNKADGGDGGAIYSDFSTLNIEGTGFIDNNAANGKNLYIQGGDSVFIYNSIIEEKDIYNEPDWDNEDSLTMIKIIDDLFPTLIIPDFVQGDSIRLLLRRHTAGDEQLLGLSDPRNFTGIADLTINGIQIDNVEFNEGRAALFLNLDPGSYTATIQVPNTVYYKDESRNLTCTYLAASATSNSFTVSPSYNYLEWDDTQQKLVSKDTGTDKIFVYELDGTEGTLGTDGQTTWYVAQGTDLSYTGPLTLQGDAHLILADDCNMNVVTDSGSAICGDGSLTIYAQSAGDRKGKLTATGSSYGIYAAADVILNGGDITATATAADAGAIVAEQGFTYNGGTVTTTATGTGAHAISALGGLYTFSWSSPDDHITIGTSGLYSDPDAPATVTFTRLFSDDDAVIAVITRSVTDSELPTDHYYGGTLTTDALTDLNARIAITPDGLTLRGTERLNLTDDDFAAVADPYASNITRIAAADGIRALALAADRTPEPLTVLLEGRRLWKDGDWNTLCLPFALSDFTDTPLEGATVKTLVSSSFENGTLTINFTDDENNLTSIDAGVPYIVKWSSQTPDYVDNPVFADVIVTATVPSSITTDGVDFVGTFSPVDIFTAENTNLYLGSANTLYYPWADGMTSFNLNAFRAYFKLNNGLTAGDPADPSTPIKAFKLNFGEEETGIETVQGSGFMVNGEGFMVNGFGWYTLDGRRLDAQPAAPGIYLHNGRKLLIK